MSEKDDKKTKNDSKMFDDRRRKQEPIDPGSERRKKSFEHNEDWYLRIPTSKSD